MHWRIQDTSKKSSVKFNAGRVEQSQIPTRGGVADSDGSEITSNIECMS